MGFFYLIGTCSKSENFLSSKNILRVNDAQVTEKKCLLQMSISNNTKTEKEKGNQEMNGYKKIKQQLVHKGNIIDVYQDVIQLPNGKEVTWDFVKHKGAAAVVAIDEDGKIIMVHQYRNSVDRMSLEIPAGGINDGENSKEAAIRELEEETGYVAGNIELLVDAVTAIGFSNETIAIYVATDLTKTQQHLDEDEFVEIRTYDVEELVTMILDGKIKDAKTIAGVFAYRAKFLQK